jgi:hypothetical protein
MTSVLTGIARELAQVMGFSITVGTPDALQFSVEPAVIWTQPEENRYVYTQPRHQPTSNTSMLDRYIAIDVTIRAPGSEKAMLDLSDKFWRAVDFKLGGEGYGWRLVGNAAGGGSNLDQGVYLEVFRLLVRYDVVQSFYTQDEAPLTVVTSENEDGEAGIFVEGPAQGQNVEQVI